MRTRLPRVAGLLLACTLLVAPPAPVGGASGDPQGQPTRHRHHVPQTSDGVQGEIATPMPSFLRRLRTTTTPLTRWTVAPGVTYARWSQSDRRGPIRAHLLTVDLDTPGLTIDYAAAGSVRRTAPVRDILARHHAIAGVNGDFYDIGDTGAPLGIGQDRQAGFLHAPRNSWNSAFVIDRLGRPDIGYVPLVVRVRNRPRLDITNYNSPEVRPGGIGVYTPGWGRTAGYRITGGQQTQVRMVRVVGKRVVQVKNKLTVNKPIKGYLLVGRGEGAKRLTALKKGSWVTLERHLQGKPRVAITGNKFLIRDGLVEVVNDREMHPRTAVGIDRDTNEVLLLAIDGRQSFSRGYTMVELAEMMQDLGADEALNLDGGGSTTMLARRDGVVGVVNSPSDGFERSVANALEVLYTAP